MNAWGEKFTQAYRGMRAVQPDGSRASLKFGVQSIGPFATTTEMPLRMCWAMHCGIEEAQTNHTTCFSGPVAHHNELTMV